MKGYGKFLLKATLAILMAGAVIVGAYVLLDPFKVLRHYDNYYPSSDVLQPEINQATMTVANFHPSADSLNAYLMGTSLSGHILVDQWRRYLPENARPYHFFSSWEGLESIAESIEKLDREGSVDYALIILTPRMLFKDYTYDPAEVSHPAIQHTLSTLRYHWVFVKGFCHRDWLRSYIASRLSGCSVEINHVSAIDKQKGVYDPEINELRYYLVDSLIEADPEAYYASNRFIESLPANHYRMHSQGIVGERVDLLRRIGEVLRRNNTDYEVIIPATPCGDMVNSADLAILKREFGADRVHDLSRPLNWMSLVDTMWYDDMHYRPSGSKVILDTIYQRKSARKAARARSASE